MSVFLHVHHDDDLHEVAYVKAVRSRVEAYIKLHFLVLQKLTDLFLVRRLLNEASRFEHIVNIIMFAYTVRYKIVFHLSVFPPTYSFYLASIVRFSPGRHG